MFITFLISGNDVISLKSRPLNFRVFIHAYVLWPQTYLRPSLIARVLNQSRNKSSIAISLFRILVRNKRKFYEQKELTPTGLAWDTNMAAVLLFGDKNMADVKSCETALSVKCKTVLAIASKEWLKLVIASPTIEKKDAFRFPFLSHSLGKVPLKAQKDWSNDFYFITVMNQV